MLRCSPPRPAQAGADAFDKSLHAALHRVVVGEGPGFGPLQDEIASLPLSAGGLGIPRAEDILPYAFLASATQTLRLQEELLGDREVPVVGALRLAQEYFCTEVPLVHQDLMGDSIIADVGLQAKLGSLLSDHRRRALLALPAKERLLEVIESAARPHAGAWLQALPVLRLGQTMAAVEFRCRLQYHLMIPMYRAGSRCPRCSGIMDR